MSRVRGTTSISARVGPRSTRLAELAVPRSTRRFGWDDLVLAERQIAVLRSISAYLRHRDLVLSEWGYEQIGRAQQGLKVLFAGESGTGKTMAAQVLASDLGLDLFRIDLATVVSKYIGETEKNLDRVFDAAEGSNAILFFDEADALFGKRSEVRDAHDRYANIEVAYLLQKMEAYPGAVILATNFRQNIDDAFLRRLDFVVDFPFPERGRPRAHLAAACCRRPRRLADDIDVEFLAERFKLVRAAASGTARWRRRSWPPTPEARSAWSTSSAASRSSTRNTAGWCLAGVRTRLRRRHDRSVAGRQRALTGCRHNACGCSVREQPAAGRRPDCDTDARGRCGSPRNDSGQRGRGRRPASPRPSDPAAGTGRSTSTRRLQLATAARWLTSQRAD